VQAPLQMPICRDYYTRGSETKATARSEKFSLTSGLLYGDFHFFTPMFYLESEKVTDNIQNLLGGLSGVILFTSFSVLPNLHACVFTIRTA
jgi:hypothetical protein